MTILRIDPKREIERATRRMGDLIRDIEKGISFEVGGFTPRVDIIEEEKQLNIFVELPGLAKDDFKVAVDEDRMLVIKGEKKRTGDTENKSYLRTERAFGAFSRSFFMPDGLDVDNISAKFSNGVLELVVPKIEPPKPKEINIEL
jgi:HSP20 family protein